MNKKHSFKSIGKSLFFRQDAVGISLTFTACIGVVAVSYQSLQDPSQWPQFLGGTIAGLAISFAAFYLSDRKIVERTGIEDDLERKLTSATFDTVDASIVVLDSDGRILRFNRKCERMTGYTFDEVRNKHFWDIFLTPEEIEPVKSVFASLIEGGWANCYENVWVTKDGDRRAIAWSNTVLLNQENKVAYVIGTGLDVTERRLVEAESNKFFSLVQNSNEFIAMASLDSKATFVNEAGCKLVGLDNMKAALSTQINDYHPPRAQTLIEEEVLPTILQDGIWQGENQLKHFKTGESIDVEQTAFLIKHPRTNAPICLATVMRDIRDRKRTIEELRLQNSRSQLFSAITLRIRQSLDTPKILNTAVTQVRRYLKADRVLIYCFDKNWDGMVIAESVSRKWSLSSGIIIRDTCFQEGLWREYQRGKRTAIDDVAQANLSPCHKELLSQFQVQANLVVPILGSLPSDGSLSHLKGLLIVHQCSKPRHWLNTEIDLVGQLADQVGIALYQAQLLERATQQQEQLIQQNLELDRARREAEAATRMRSDFLATMSHEIRTPMNAVLGMTGLLMDTNLSVEQSEFAEVLRLSGENLLTLINDILDFSKLEAGEAKLEIVDFNLSNCIEEITSLLASSAQSKGLEIASLIYQDVPLLIRGDISRLRQILVNLVSNAVKFTTEGEVIVRVVLASETTDTATIKFSVSDTGIGIPLDARQKLFEPFTQVDASTTRKYGGTGLGLAICKQTVELMGGAIGVESDEGIGSEFWVTLTFAKQSNLSQAAEQTFLDDELKNIRTLVVDDSETNCKILSYQLSSWQMQVDTANCAEAALTAMYRAVERGEPYELAILDMQMPDIDGDMLGRQIKSDPKLQSTKLIMMTSIKQRGAVHHMKEIGFAAYLVKPIKKSRLLDCLVKVMFPFIYHHAIAAESNAASSSPQRRSQKSKLKILLAEDSPINQKVTINQLKRLGYEADVAANGLEVLHAIAQIPYDLILMDCRMPELDGYNTARAIRQLAPPHRDITIVALTADAMKEDRERCLEVGMNDYLSKPIRPEDLNAKLVAWEQKIFPNESFEETEEGDVVPATNENVESGDSVTPINELSDVAINWEFFDLVAGGNVELKELLLQEFVDFMPLHLEALKTAIAHKNYAEIADKAHLIKGSSTSIGITAMELPAAQLLQQGRSENLENAEGLLQEMITVLERIQNFVRSKGAIVISF